MTDSQVSRVDFDDDEIELEGVLLVMRRERTLKALAALAGMATIIASLIAVAYLNFDHTYQPGPPRVMLGEAHPGQVYPLALSADSLMTPRRAQRALSR